MQSPAFRVHGEPFDLPNIDVLGRVVFMINMPLFTSGAG